jgi:Zn-dependent peptidase ImmA (M78 family)
MATASFCAQETEIDGRARRITLSKIFLWYASDFGDTTYEVLEWMLRYLPAGNATILQGLLGAWGISPPKVAYRKYDWGLNSKSRHNDADDDEAKKKKKDKAKKPAIEEVHRTRSESMLVPTRQPGKATRPRSMSD